MITFSNQYDGTMRFPDDYTKEMMDDFYSLQYWNLHYYVMNEKHKYITVRNNFITKYGVDRIKSMERMFTTSLDYVLFWKERGLDNVVRRNRG